MPLAPGLFSTTKDWPVLSSMYLPTRRAVMSPEPPGAKGTMMCTALLGQASARTGNAAAVAAARNARRESDLRNIGMACSLKETQRVDSARHAALLCTHVTVWSSPAHRHPRRRLHARHRRTALHANPLGHGRRDHQDRESGRR